MQTLPRQRSCWRHAARGVILDAKRQIAGILSERDIVRALAARGAAALGDPVVQVMTPNVKTCSEDETIEGVMRRMTAGKFRHMPVARDGLLGLVSIGDIVKQRLREIEVESEELRVRLKDLEEIVQLSRMSLS